MKSIESIRRENLRAQVKLAGSQKKLADKIGVDKNQIYQWLRVDPATGQQRNMGRTSAREAEKELGLDDGWFDTDHSAAPATQPSALPAGLAESRPKNDIHAIRVALQGFATVLHRMRPDIAADVAREIVGVAGLQFSGQGFANTLLGFLVGVEQTSEEALRELLQQPVSSKSKRGSARAK